MKNDCFVILACFNHRNSILSWFIMSENKGNKILSSKVRLYSDTLRTKMKYCRNRFGHNRYWKSILTLSIRINILCPTNSGRKSHVCCLLDTSIFDRFSTWLFGGASSLLSASAGPKVYCTPRCVAEPDATNGDNTGSGDGCGDHDRWWWWRRNVVAIFPWIPRNLFVTNNCSKATHSIALGLAIVC